MRLLRSALGPGNAAADGAAEGPLAAYMDPSARLQLQPDGGAKRAARKVAAPVPDEAVPPLRVNEALAGGAGGAYFGSRAFRAAALGAAVGVVARAAEVFGGVPALPEVLAPARAALEALGSEGGLPAVRANPKCHGHAALCVWAVWDAALTALEHWPLHKPPS